MRTFIIRARKGTTRWELIKSQIGGKEHIEVVAHSIMNAFFISSDFRKDIEVYLILDSSPDFPRTIKLSSAEGLSLSGFHEEAILNTIETALKSGQQMQKDETSVVEKGVTISAFGFEKLLKQFLPTRPVYLLEPKGEDIREMEMPSNPVFILSDHLALPKKTVQSFKKQGMQALSLGKKMLFASQCITLINHELDRMGS